MGLFMNVSRGDFREYGPRICGREAVTFTFAVNAASEKISILLFDKTTKKQISAIELSDEHALGLVYSVTVSGINPDNICYLLKESPLSQALLVYPYLKLPPYVLTWLLL